MLFSGIPFLYGFLPAVILLYCLAPRRGKNAVLLLASLFFYAWGERLLVLLFAASILAGWGLGLAIDRFRGRPAAKGFLVASILLSLGLLGYFKYADFFLASVNAATGLSLPLLGVALPIGISFYTFQLLSYTVDVYRGTPAQRDLIDFAAYVALFPQLIAGPILRYRDIAPQLRGRRATLEDVALGVRRFILGLGKKVLLANVLGELCAAYRASADPSVLFAWLYALAYMLQVYFDFSGYSDMAIGLGRLFGFRFPENFRYPYMARSVTEFWRRWHISLGSWFRDYVYIPLGGNRRGLPRQLLNIAVVWMLTGLWHGAAWNFVLWGLYFALLLTLEKLFLLKRLEKRPALGHLWTLFTVMLGFVLFNAEGLAQMARDAAALFGLGRLPPVSAEAVYLLRSYGVTLLVGLLAATPLPARLVGRLRAHPAGERALALLEPLTLTALLLLATAFLVDGSFNPFLYFRF